MNIIEIFESHFTQCSEAVEEFKYLGKSYRGKWRKNESMAFFLKDLIEAAAELQDDEYGSIAAAKEEIKELEKTIEEREEAIEQLEKTIEEREKVK